MAVPSRIGRYPITGVLGQGNMGIVYRGRDESLDREVAIKVMGTEGGDADSRLRFRREALAAGRLQHPNIVTIFELGEHEGRPFIAMELLEGVDLREAIEAGLRPDPRTTLPIVLQVLAGLGHAHEHGVVHRDVKPSNVFLPRGRPAKLMDFGVARLSGGATTAGAIVGTPNYMSPEQVEGGSVDNRSDLFSAGLILYELVTGERAYVADTMVAVLYKIAHETPDLSLLPRDDRWAGLRAVLERALARAPADRYATAEAMATDLVSTLMDLGGNPGWATIASPRAAPRPPQEQSRSSGETEAADPPPEIQPFRPTGRHLFVGIALGTVVLVGGILGGLAWMRLSLSSGTATPTPPERLSLAVGSPAPSPMSAEARATPSRKSATPTPTPPTTPAAVQRTPTPAAASETTPSRASAGDDATGPERVSPPSSARGDIDVANALLEQRRYRSALNEARAILQRDPSHKEAQIVAEEAEAALVVEERLESARSAMSRGDRDAALEEVRGGLAVAPNDARLMALFRELTR